MREDMGKVVVERPRRGSRERNIKTRMRFRGANVDYDDVDENVPTVKIGHKLAKSQQLGYDGKQLNEHLEPLKRFIISNCGRPWDKVYSEISQVCPVNSVLGHHIIIDHLFSYVDTNAYEANGVIYSDKIGIPVPVKEVEGSSRNIAYVHPKTGILTRYKGKSKRLGWHTPNSSEREINFFKDETREWRKENGTWFAYEYTYDPGTEKVKHYQSRWGKKEDGTSGVSYVEFLIERNRIPGFEPYKFKGKRTLSKKEIKDLTPSECGNYDHYKRVRTFIPAKNWGKI
jgi:hypothetical protein